jgi:hypothetical protein
VTEFFEWHLPFMYGDSSHQDEGTQVSPLTTATYYNPIVMYYVAMSLLVAFVGRLVVVIDVNPSHGFWTTRLIKVFGHEGKCTCIYNTH